MMRLLFLLLFSLPAFATINEVDRAEIFQRQLLVNGGFESGRASWTASGGSFAAVTSGSNLLQGAVSATWDSSSASQTLTSTARTIPNGWYGRNGAASCLIMVPSGSATHTLSVFDGTNTLVSQSITSSATPTRTTVNFIFPSSGSLSVRLTSVAADEPSITIDGCFLGPAEGFNVTALTQATFVGGMDNAGASSCAYGENTSSGVTDYVDLGTGTSCAAWTVTSNGPGTISAQGTNDHRLVFTNMPPGNYLFFLTGSFGPTSAGSCRFRLSDGTNVYTPNMYSNAAGDGTMPLLQFSVNITTAGTRTYKLQAADGGAFTCRWNNDSSTAASWKIYRFPLSSEQAFTPDTSAWRLDLNIGGAGNNIDLGTSTQASYVTPNNANLTMTINTSKGSAQAGISCSSTNDNSVGSTTCSAGSEEPGFVANFPRAGLVEVCYSMTHRMTTAATGNVIATFQVVRTANGSQTIAEQGGARVTSSLQTASISTGNPLTNLCGTFQIPSAGKHTIRLMYEQVITATVSSNFLTTDEDVNNGQRDIKITARYVDQSTPMPILTNTVTTQLSGGIRVEYVSFGGAVEGTNNCTSSPCTIYRQSGAVTSVTRSTTGRYTLNFNAGVFSGAPTCVGNAQEIGVGRAVISFGTPTTTSVAVVVDNNTGVGAADAGNVNIQCMGPR